MVHFSQCSTVAVNCSTETQIEMRDGTVENFPEPAVVSVEDGVAVEYVVEPGMLEEDFIASVLVG